MTLKGYTVPRTPDGRASLVPSPPWHYVGDFIVIDFHADPQAAASLLPDGLEPHPDAGRCAAVFADWQSYSEGGDELTDPVRSQYKEFYIVVSGQLDGEPVTTCPFIWVNQDFALVRGHIQGFPKKLGDVWMTRSFDLDCKASPGVRAGARFGATCSARGRELARATLALEQESASGSVHTDPPLVNVRYFPRLAAGQHDDPAVHELVRARSRDRSVSTVWEGPATLELSPAPGEEHTLLAPLDVVRGYRFTFAYTVDDLDDRQGVSAMSATARAGFATVAGHEVSTDHWIGGERVASSDRFEVITPIDGSVIARVAAGGAEEADLAVRAAHAASSGWAALGAAGRAQLLHRLADLIDANVEKLAAVECADMAMLLESLRLRVIFRAAANFRNYADLAVAYEERDWHSKGTWNRVQRMPAGPAAVITPVERAVHAVDLEDRAGARRRLPGRPEAGRVVPPLLLPAGRSEPPRPGSRPASSTSSRASASRSARRSSRTRCCAASPSPAHPRPRARSA